MEEDDILANDVAQRDQLERDLEAEIYDPDGVFGKPMR